MSTKHHRASRYPLEEDTRDSAYKHVNFRQSYSAQEAQTHENLAQAEPFSQWIPSMHGYEVQVPRHCRVYLVLSTLRRVGAGAQFTDGLLAPSRAASAAVKESLPNSSHSSNSSSKRARPSYNDIEYDSVDDEESVDDSEGELNLKTEGKKMLKVGKKLLGQMLGINEEVRYHSESDYTASLGEEDAPRRYQAISKDQTRATGRDHQRGMTSMPYSGYPPSLEDVTSSTNLSARNRLLGPQATPATSRSRDYGRAISFFSASNTSEQHWALQIGTRYFELEVRKEIGGHGLRKYSHFTCRNRTGHKDARDVIARVFAGTTHMSHRVVQQIGTGIMKTQARYDLRTDNCQHFLALLLPRILCSRHAYMPCLPNASVSWAYKYTTFPVYDVGVKEGPLIVVSHRYFSLASLGHKVVDKFSRKGESEVPVNPDRFQCSELSSYYFKLQGDDSSRFNTCYRLDRNPYLYIHRTFEKKSIQPMANSKFKENRYHLWEENRRVKETDILRQLKTEQAIEAAKITWRLWEKTKWDWVQRARYEEDMEASRKDDAIGG